MQKLSFLVQLYFSLRPEGSGINNSRRKVSYFFTLPLFLVLVFSFNFALFCQLKEEDTDKNKKVCVTFFFSPTCEACHEARKIIEVKKFMMPSLEIVYISTASKDGLDKLLLYDKHYNVPKEKELIVPAVFVGDDFLIDVPDIEENFDDVVSKYEKKGGVKCLEINKKVDEGKSVEEKLTKFTTIAVIGAGLIDGINPCAFATLIFFISGLFFTGRKGKQILLIGVSFTSGVFIAYLLMGLGFLKSIHSLEQFKFIAKLIYPITGIIAFSLGAWSIYDFIKAKKGKIDEMVLKLPTPIRRYTEKFIRKQIKLLYFTIGAFLTGFLVSLFEFLCTGQIYLPTIVFVLSKTGKYWKTAFYYLIIYNLMFVFPLIVIFTSVYLGASHRKINTIMVKNVFVIKFLTALLFISLAGYMFYFTIKIF